MGSRILIDGLIMYLGLLVLLTFHEFGHAWMALRCGDDTARSQGRVSLNPLAHIDPIGTVALPLLMILLPGLSGFLIGWAKPVPVNPYNLRNPKVDDILVTLAGPWMNLLLAIVLMGLARVGLMVHSAGMMEIGMNWARLSLMLCFFNLIPIPPLDGSQVLRSVTGMSYEAYAQFARFGFIVLIIALQFQPLQYGLALVTLKSQSIIGGWFGIAMY
jgi:Zn-dependent protease